MFVLFMLTLILQAPGSQAQQVRHSNNYGTVEPQGAYQPEQVHHHHHHHHHHHSDSDSDSSSGSSDSN